MDPAHGETDPARTDPTTTGRLVDLDDQLPSEDVGRLVALSAIGPQSTTADEIMAFFADDPERFLAGWADDHHLLGVVGGFLRPGPILEVEVLAVDPDWRHRGIARQLIDATADHHGALAIRLETDGPAVSFFERCGFTLRSIGEIAGVPRYRAERRHPPEPPGFFTSPRLVVDDARRVAVELPPSGNTLPVIPPELRDEDVPAFVLRWILDADEIGLILQALHPESFPPVTPAVRPTSIAETTGTAASHDPERTDSGQEHVGGQPAGVEVPAAVLDTIAMAERVARWLDEGRRVRAWAESHGHGDAPWILPEGT